MSWYNPRDMPAIAPKAVSQGEVPQRSSNQLPKSNPAKTATANSVPAPSADSQGLRASPTSGRGIRPDMRDFGG